MGGGSKFSVRKLDCITTWADFVFLGAARNVGPYKFTMDRYWTREEEKVLTNMAGTADRTLMVASSLNS